MHRVLFKLNPLAVLLRSLQLLIADTPLLLALPQVNCTGLATRRRFAVAACSGWRCRRLRLRHVHRRQRRQRRRCLLASMDASGASPNVQRLSQLIFAEADARHLDIARGAA